jgi:hypothetical protein
MSNMNLHIKDALDGASPGTLIASPETTTLHGPLRALIGKDAANLVLKRAGRTGVLHMSEAELVATTGIAPELARRLVVARRLFATRRRPTNTIQCSSQVLEALPVGLSMLETEVLLGIALDTAMKPIATVFFAKGGATGAAIVPRDVFTPLLRLNTKCSSWSTTIRAVRQHRHGMTSCSRMQSPSSAMHLTSNSSII